MKTTTPKASAPAWYLVDAKGKVLGRLAADLAHILRGKHKPTWSPHTVMSDNLVVLNAGEIVLTGKKAQTKQYVRHSGHIGRLRYKPFARLFSDDPTSILRRAVRGMLPRNRLRKEMMKHLHIFEGQEHPHDAQKPVPLPLHS